MTPPHVPKWFSLDVINIGDASDPKKVQKFYEILTSGGSLELENAWRSLDKRYCKAKTKYPHFPHNLFWCLFNYSVLGPGEFLKKPLKEIDDLADEINSATDSLIKMIKLTNTDFPLSTPFGFSLEKRSSDDLKFSAVLNGWREAAFAIIGHQRKFPLRQREIQKKFISKLCKGVVTVI